MRFDLPASAFLGFSVLLLIVLSWMDVPVILPVILALVCGYSVFQPGADPGLNIMAAVLAFLIGLSAAALK